MNKPLFSLFVVLVMLLSSAGMVHAEPGGSQDHTSVQATVMQLRQAGEQAGAAWARLSPEQQEAVLQDLKPSFYMEGKKGSLVSITATKANTNAKSESSVPAPTGGKSGIDAWGGDYSVRSVYGCGQYYTRVTSVRGNGPQTLTLTYQATASNSWNANVGVDAGAVSAGVGFNVEWSTSWSYGSSTEVPAGQTWEIEARNLYDGYSFDVWWDPWGSDPPRYDGYGYAYNFYGVDYYVWRVY